jgi:thioredoxin-related protein
MALIVHGLEAEYYGNITFVFLDADDPATASFQREYGFFVQPEFYLLDGEGKVIKKWVGYVSAEEFRAEFAQLP